MEKTELRYEVIQKTLEISNNKLSVKELCELAGVSRSGYYRWLDAAPLRAERERKDKEDFNKILIAYRYRGYDKGVQGIRMRLLRMGTKMNHKKIRRLMRKYRLNCPIRERNPYKAMMREMQTDVVFDNLINREFKAHGPRKILLTDITYIKLKEGFVYLSVIIDAYTMQVLAYQLSDSLKMDFVLKTVNDLIRVHGISLDEETCIHSDQGSHYTSISFRKLIKDSELRQSMSRRGNCWDNAPQESFFGHMKDELKPYASRWETFDDVKARIDDWIDYYNKDRYQVGLKQLSPNEYYHYLMTGENPLEKKDQRYEATGAGTESRDSTLNALAFGQPLTK